MRPEGASEVESDFFDNRTNVLDLASQEAVKASKVSALTQAEMYDKLDPTKAHVTSKVKKWLKNFDIESGDDWHRKEIWCENNLTQCERCLAPCAVKS